MAEPMARFKSSKDDTVVYQVHRELTCTCPGFQFRHDCQHIQAVLRFEKWDIVLPNEILPPPAEWQQEAE